MGLGRVENPFMRRFLYALQILKGPIEVNFKFSRSWFQPDIVV